MQFKRSVYALCALAFAAPLGAQQPNRASERVGYVVAVVGDSVILNYDLEEDLLRLRAQGTPVPQPGPELQRLQREMLEQRIDNLVVLQAAVQDTSLVLDGQQITAAVQAEVVRRQRALGGQQQLDDALRRSGLTMLEFRNSLETQIRRDRLLEMYISKQRSARRPPPVTEGEMRQFLEDNRASLGQRPATIEFEQVVIPVTPTDSALQRARMEADSVRALLLAGGDFEDLARRFSDAPGARENAGDLGFFRESDMVRPFARAAFSMRPGEVSEPVRTSFGFHIIKLERVRGSERQARHILIIPETTQADTERARALAETVAGQLRAGAAVDSLIQRHGDPEEERRLGPLERDRLPAPYDTGLSEATSGSIVGPLDLGVQSGSGKFAVVRVLEVKPSGEYSLDDPLVRQQVRTRLEQQKLLEEIVSELRRRTYIDIREI